MGPPAEPSFSTATELSETASLPSAFWPWPLSPEQQPSSQVLGPEAYVTYVLSASWGRSRLGTIRAAQLKRPRTCFR